MAFSITGQNEQGEPVTATYTGKVVSPTKMTGTVSFQREPLAQTGTTDTPSDLEKKVPDNVDVAGLTKRGKTKPQFEWTATKK